MRPVRRLSALTPRGIGSPTCLAVLFLTVLLHLPGCVSLFGTRNQAEPDWAFKGKLGYRAPAGAVSVLVEWRQYPRERFEVVLRTVLGVAVARLEGAPDGPVTLHYRGRQTQFADPEAAAAAALGTSVPLPALRHWVRGEAGPGVHTVTDSGLIQNGWDVSLKVGASGLPSRVVMRQGDVRFVLAVRSWQ